MKNTKEITTLTPIIPSEKTLHLIAQVLAQYSEPETEMQGCTTLYIAPEAIREKWPIENTDDTITVFTRHLDKLIGSGSTKEARRVLMMRSDNNDANDPRINIYDLVCLVAKVGQKLNPEEFHVHLQHSQEKIAPTIHHPHENLMIIERGDTLQAVIEHLIYTKQKSHTFATIAKTVIDVMHRHRRQLDKTGGNISTDLQSNNIIFTPNEIGELSANIIDYGLVVSTQELSTKGASFNECTDALKKIRCCLQAAPPAVLLAMFALIGNGKNTNPDNITDEQKDDVIRSLLTTFGCDANKHLQHFTRHIELTCRLPAQRQTTEPHAATKSSAIEHDRQTTPAPSCKTVFDQLRVICLTDNMENQIRNMFGDLRQYIRNEFHFHCTAMILLRAYVNIAMKTVAAVQLRQVFNALHQFARTSLQELDGRTTARGSQPTKNSPRLFPDAGEEDRHRKATECFDSINQITA